MDLFREIRERVPMEESRRAVLGGEGKVGKGVRGVNEEKKWDIFSLSENGFKEYIFQLTSETVISAEAFTAAMAAAEPFVQQKRLELLRQQAKALGVSSKKFDGLRAAFCKGLEQRKKEKRKQEEEEARLLGNSPFWYSKGKIDETAFCTMFREYYGELRCINGQFYSIAGMVQEGEISQTIQEMISPYISSRLAAKTGDLIRALKNACYISPPAPEQDKIHVDGGYIDLKGAFHPELLFCMNRLNVKYDPKANAPKVWLDYLDALLDSEDIKTLQEYLGYCLLATTKAEKMLFLIGNGGEGKSVLGAVLADLFGSSSTFGSLHDLETNRFSLADLEAKLLFIDDDLSVNACPESKTQKSLVTAKAPLRLERKGQQSYNAPMYCRLIAFGNVPFTTLYDHSDGAFRRRIILTTKPKPPDRKDNRNLTEEIVRGKSGVFNWILEGLWRLIGNGWEFSTSQRTKANLEESKRENFNLIEFLEDKTALRLGNYQDKITSRNFYTAYERWCHINEKYPLKSKTVLFYLKQNENEYKIKYSKHILDENKGEARGFEGVKLLDRRLIYIP